MPLPKIDLPIYEMTVPSTEEVIKVRPFTVKEEKLLLIAVESNNMDEIIPTVKQVINNCIVEGKADVDKLPFFDIDYMFIFLRGKSVGETVEVRMTCQNETEEGICGNKIRTEMDISKVEIEKPEIESKIMLTSDKGVVMKYPNYAAMKRTETMNDAEMKSHIMVNSIDYIFDKDGIYPSKDYSKEEMKEFVDGLTEGNFKKMEEFVDNFPKFSMRLQAKCNKCGFDHDVRYTDFYDFFT